MIPKTTRGVFLIVLAAMLAAAATAQGGDVGRHTLSNGIRVLTMPAEWNRIVAVSVMVDAGSKHDPRKLNGLAYITNSLLTQGTTTMSAIELAEYTDSRGIELGTELTHDLASVYVTSIDSQLDVALEVLADVLQNPAFDERRLLEEQRIAHEALQNEQRDPYSAPFRRIDETLFGKHPYAVPARGTEKGLDRITARHVVDFHQRRYVAGSTVISVVGNFSPRDVVDRLEELFADYPEGTASETEFPEAFGGGKDFNVFKDVDEAALGMGFVAPSSGHEDYAALRVAVTILGEGNGSRLQSALGPRGADLTESTGSYCMCRDEISLVALYAIAEEIDEAHDIIVDVLHGLSTEPVTDEELARARSFVVGRQAVSGQTNLVRAGRLAAYELAGHGFQEDAFLRAVNRVDKDDVIRVASEWFVKPVTVVVRPGKSAAPQSGKPARAGI